MYRILIADDEPIECRAMQKKLENWFSMLEIVPSAGNGLELLEAVDRYRPDILIVDINMPGLGGLDALEILRAGKQKMKIVIHTAYSEFDYAKRAIELGASAYVLKPDADDEMRGVIKRLCAELDQEESLEEARQENQREVDNLRDIAAQKWFLSLYFGETDEECWQVLCKNWDGLENGGFLSLWNLHQGRGDFACTLSEARKFVIWQMKARCSCMEFQYREDLVFLVIPKERGSYPDWYRRICRSIFEELKPKNIQAYVGASQWKTDDRGFLSGLHEALTEVQRARTYEVSFFRPQEGAGSKPDISRSVHAFLPQLLKGEVDACLEKARGELYGIKDREEQKAVTFLWLFEVKESLAHGREEQMDREWRLWRNFADLESAKELDEWLTDGIRMCCSGAGAANQNHYIRKMCAFVDENYGSDLSLEQAAEVVGISYFYLSRLLKQELQMTFSELLTDIRLWRAIALMKNPNKTTKEIGEEVGYPNTTYFYKVFKKNTGISVGSMRKFLQPLTAFSSSVEGPEQEKDIVTEKHGKK